MDTIQIIVIAIVQGITEFLPISSSGHLILIAPDCKQVVKDTLPQLADRSIDFVNAVKECEERNLTTDVMVHVGSLFAVLVYFWRDVLRLIKGGFELLLFKWTDNSRMASYILIATIPAVIFALILKKTGAIESIRTMEVVGWNLIIFGILLYITDRFGLSERMMKDMRMSPAVIIGVAQALALIPGTSRSGATITAARALGYERADAARFSFLLGIPAIAGAGLLTYLNLLENGKAVPTEAIYAAGLTFFAALGAIAFLMSLVRRFSFLPYVIYRLILGTVLLYLVYSG